MAPADGPDQLRRRYAAQPFLMAPMAGVTDAAYRIMARRRGATTCSTEMVSAVAITYGNEKTWRLVDPEPEEPQIVVQLFGSKPELFARAAAAVEERVGERLTAIDINMGCPARKVASKGEGAALLEEPELAEAIVRATVEAVDVPVMVKMRSGLHAGESPAPELAARFEQAGACAVAVHGRTADEQYMGHADWGVIDEVAARVRIPVIGSGDVFCAADAVRMLTTTAAEAVYIARGTYGDPWVFGDALALLRDGAEPPERSSAERLDALREHLTLLHETQPYMARARTFGPLYLKGMPHASYWRHRIMDCRVYEEYLALVDDIEADVAACERFEEAGIGIPPAPVVDHGVGLVYDTPKRHAVSEEGRAWQAGHARAGAEPAAEDVDVSAPDDEDGEGTVEAMAEAATDAPAAAPAAAAAPAPAEA